MHQKTIDQESSGSVHQEIWRQRSHKQIANNISSFSWFRLSFLSRSLGHPNLSILSFTSHRWFTSTDIKASWHWRQTGTLPVGAYAAITQSYFRNFRLLVRALLVQTYISKNDCMFIRRICNYTYIHIIYNMLMFDIPSKKCMQKKHQVKIISVWKQNEATTATQFWVKRKGTISGRSKSRPRPRCWIWCWPKMTKEPYDSSLALIIMFRDMHIFKFCRHGIQQTVSNFYVFLFSGFSKGIML